MSNHFDCPYMDEHQTMPPPHECAVCSKFSVCLAHNEEFKNSLTKDVLRIREGLNAILSYINAPESGFAGGLKAALETYLLTGVSLINFMCNPSEQNTAALKLSITFFALVFDQILEIGTIFKGDPQ